MNPIGILLATTMTIAALMANANERAMRKQAAKNLGTDRIEKAWENSKATVAAYNRDGGGFAITATDGALVGYSDSGTFSKATAPAALIELLEYPHTASYTPKDARYTPVEPLLERIAWDQNDPYNLLCPVYYGSQRSATGCAATAMAQIMRYHNYPDKGSGTNTYTPDNASLGEISVDFTQSTYDWANMPPTYGASSTETQRQAVARLMYDAGVAISMNYGAMSGAMSQDWPDALVRYFGYDPGVTMLQRAFIDTGTWDATIRAEIAAGRPVYATGFTSTGGHAFVFDGYDEQGMVHVNWGWGGMSNGYFDTEWLTPSTQGTGGSNGGFNSRQLIVTGICPPVAENLTSVILASEEGLTAQASRIDKSTPAKIKLPGKVYNHGWQAEATFVTALRVVDATGAKVTESRFTTEPVSLAKGASTVGLSFPELDMSALPDGQYSIVAIARPADGIRSERIQDLDLDFPNYLSATIADGHIKFQAPEMSVLSSTAPVVNGQFYCDARSCIRATLGNNGGTAYNGTVAMALTDISTGRIVAKGDAFTKDVQPGQSVDIELTSVFNVQPGRYGLVITDRSGHKVSPATEIEAMEACEGSPIASSGPDFGDNNRVTPLAVNASAVITATPGTAFSGYLYLYIYKDGSEDVAGSLGPVFAQASGGSETKVIFDGRFENGQPGQSYEARLVNGENFTYVTPRDVATTQFTIDGGASIELTENATISENATSYYSIDGRRLTSAPAKGFYIEISGGKASKKHAR